MDRKSAGRIILIRHGETEANRSRCFADSDDIPLTDTGRSQSHALALRLSREFRAQILISSPFRRAQETGEIIGRVLGLAELSFKPYPQTAPQNGSKGPCPPIAAV
jgi:broad specificity phosphatase PhoE